MEHYKNLQIEDIEGEEWIDAIGYDGLYEVSNLGRVKSLSRWVSNGKSERLVKERILSQALSKDGRLTVVFSQNNISRSQVVSNIVYYSFNRNSSVSIEKKEVVHLDKIQVNNILDNLQLLTIKESKKIAINKGKFDYSAINKYNRDRSLEYKKITKKTCSNCGYEKDITKFDYGRKKCKDCRNIDRINIYKKNKSK